MIVTLSDKLQRNVKDYQILKDSEGRIKKLDQTRLILNSVSELIEQWVEVYPAVASHFSEPLKLSLQEVADDILHRIVETHTKVEKDYAANESLNALLRRVDELLNQTSAGWTGYAQRPIAAFENRTRLARDLPRMIEHMPNIEQRLSSVKLLAAKLPRHVANVERYDEHVEYLEQILRDLDGLEAEQQAFLALIHSDRATLADVTMSLLEWCRSEGLAQLLQIRFKDVR